MRVTNSDYAMMKLALEDENAALRAALQALFDNCCMIHKHWGEGSNQKEADAAVTTAEALLRTA